MIGHVARREVRGHLRSARFLALCALAVALLGTGAYVDARRFAARTAFADALDAQRQTAIALDRGDPVEAASRFGWRSGRVAADPALRAIRPPTPTSVFAIGSDLSAPGFWQFGTEGISAGPSTDAGDSLALHTATLDFEFIVRVVLSLVAFLLAADAIAGERESGVLRALFAAPVSRVDVLLGKWVGGMITLTVPVALGGAVTSGVLLLLGVPLLDPDVWPRVLVLMLGALVFLSAALTLGMLVSACCREGRTATVLLVVIWVGGVLVVPSGAALAAATIAPATPAELLRQSRSDGIRQLEAERAHILARVWRAVTGSDATPDVGELPKQTRQRYDDARREPERRLMQRKRALLREFEDRRRREHTRQAALATTLGVASPATTFAAFAAAVSGTGERLGARWERAAREHQQRLERASFDRMFGTELFDARASYLRIAYLPNPADPADRVPTYAELPEFAPPAPDLSGDLRGAAPSLLLLAAENVLFLALAALAVARMEP